MNPSAFSGVPGRLLGSVATFGTMPMSLVAARPGLFFNVSPKETLRISVVCGMLLRSILVTRSPRGIVFAICFEGMEPGVAARFREGMGLAVAGMLAALRNEACFRPGIGLPIGDGVALAAAARLPDGIDFAVAPTCLELRNGTGFPEGNGSAFPCKGIELGAAVRLRDDNGFAIVCRGIERREGACLSADIERSSKQRVLQSESVRDLLEQAPWRSIAVPALFT